jgi:hypothetical protein
MAFVMPAGDYERALRLAGASNFMEAFEAGQDRALRRQAARDQIRQREELYNMQLEDELGKRIAAEEQIVGEGLMLEDAIAGIDSQAVQPTEEMLSQAFGGGSAGTTGTTGTIGSAGSRRGGTSSVPRSAPSPKAEGKVPLADEGKPTFLYPYGDSPLSEGRRAALERSDAAPPVVNPQEGPEADAFRRDVTSRLGLPTARPRVISALDRGLPPGEFALATPRGQAPAEPQPSAGTPLALTPREQPEVGKEAAKNEIRDNARRLTDLRLKGGSEEDIKKAKQKSSDSIRDYREKYDRDGPAAGSPGADLGAALGGGAGFGGSAMMGASALAPSMLAQALSVPQAGEAALAAAEAATPVPEAAGLPPGETYPEPTAAPSPIPVSDLEQATMSLGQEAELASSSKEPAPLKEVEEVVIGEQVHNVKRGDYIYGISEDYGVSPKAVVKRNEKLFVDKKTGKPRKTTTPGGKVLEGPNLIFPGEKVIIPTGQGAETGGAAGPIDDREGVSKGVLATVQDKAKSASEVQSELNKIQEANPDKLVNPFQKFGRSVLYTPARSSVAVAIRRAQRGNFSLINQMAGRPVKHRELVGLFADYDEFVRGAKTNAKEITLNRALAEKDKAAAEENRAHAALSHLFQDQVIRNGLSQEEAVLLGDYAADLHKIDPNLVSPFLKGYQALGAAERKEAQMRLKNSLLGTPARGSSGSVFDMKPSQIATNLRSWTNTKLGIERSISTKINSIREDPRFKGKIGADDDTGLPRWTGGDEHPEHKGLYDIELRDILRLQNSLDDAEEKIRIWERAEQRALPGLYDAPEPAAGAAQPGADPSVSPGPGWEAALLPESRGGGPVWFNRETQQTLPRS